MQRNLVILSALATLTACGSASSQSSTTHQPMIPNRVERVVQSNTRHNLETFGSKAELKKYLEDLRKAQTRDAKAGGAFGIGGMIAEEGGAAPPTPSAAPGNAPMAAAQAEDGDGAAADGEGITNNQEQGVDEGGIVKVHRDHLVVLRRGRLFTVKVGDKTMTPVSATDVRPAKGHDSWYDEMLIHDDTIIVIGFSYQAGATEIGVFDLGKRGEVSHRETFFLKSNDYYSSRNYASRLLGDKLVFYMPYWLDASANSLPGMTRYDGDEQYDDWNDIISASTIYRPIQETQNPVLHTVVTCDLGKKAGKKLDCSAEGIVGPAGRSFYVSQSAVYVWAHEGWWGPRAERKEGEDLPAPAAVYRLPLAGGDMGALRTWGAPIDQFSFKESDDGHLNVLVRAESAGDLMWGADVPTPDQIAQNDTALMRVPLSQFDRGVSSVTASAYTDLPEPTGNAWAMQNRFIGDYVLYGTGFGWGYPNQDGQETTAFAHRYKNGRAETTEVPLPHAVDRIEALGNDAVIVGSDGSNLHFTSLDLDRRPAIAGSFVQPNATQGETRSHGFFFKQSGDEQGTIGLPVRASGAPGYEHLVNGSASVLFLSVNRLRFLEAGNLASDPQTPQDDRCEVSCVDWYGNARPIFYKGRVFALLGYELVEGSFAQGRISEVGRTNMLSALPGTVQIAR